VYVPPSRGKTTAAFTYLAGNKKSVRGLALCVANTSPVYYLDMLKLLGYNPSIPPNGWWSCLVEAVGKRKKFDLRQTVLILDEYEGVPNDANDGFLKLLKAEIRNTRIHVVVLCPSKTYATHALSLNSLAGISIHFSMEWDLNTIKSAARCIPELEEFTNEAINAEVDNYVTRFSQNQDTVMACSLNPLDILRHLRTKFNPAAVSPGNALAFSFSIDQGQNVCEGCRIC
jgi:hypothetical protein